LIPDETPFLLVALLLTPLLALLGMRRLARCGSAGRTVAIAWVLAVALDYSHHQFVTHLYAYYWYWIYALPFLAVCVGTGLAEPERWMRRRWPQLAIGKPLLTAGLALLFFGMFLWQTDTGKPGRMSRPHGAVAAYSTHQRGSSNWVVYSDGRMLCQPADAPIPEAFPW